MTSSEDQSSISEDVKESARFGVAEEFKKEQTPKAKELEIEVEEEKDMPEDAPKMD
jgi:hypothetical protein